MSSTIREILKHRILVLDGAMGTMIQRYKLDEDDFRNEDLQNHHIPLKGNNDLLSMTRPDIIKAIHKEYYEAGADFAETNTFSGTTIAQADYELEHVIYDLNYQSAKIAREVADEMTALEPNKPRFVIGAMGPTNRTASISPDVNDPGYRAVTFDDLYKAYSEQAHALIDGGVDLLMVETVFDTLNAKAAIMACDDVITERKVDVSIMVSGTITDMSGRTLSGQTSEAFLISISHAPLLSVGLNCALGARELKPYLEVLSNKATFGVSAHPNAGLPNEFGEYDQTPEQMAEQVQVFLDNRYLNIVGGCCGSTPLHIKALADAAAKSIPRQF